ncbi:cupin domain-containing protein [Candidatus Reidiella endopervernicosa]|uniref:Cupin domain-containing protein n=1 Tax=Candidatus Reidiella endopervernicosa TaxID=2738883 RepID=A0A6N0I0M1_9GAMM|nr:cupin domain-containing protein [Candidatus Reidiella endopervernicosa]
MPLLNLGELTTEQFLADYWQQKPLLIRQAFPGFTSPVSAEELAGLSLEEEVESRLIIEKDGLKPWQIEHGPFEIERFAELPESHWTILVQEINKHVPELALLQERFNFIPNWRLDDVMASYAPDQGTVGPHADNYDVFLIQAHGQRHWQINNTPPTDEDLIPGLDLRIMRHFESEQDWVLEPGDMLYLPPGVAHHGVAQGDCITLSVGYRAPAVTDIASHFLAEQIAEIDPEQFYSDPQPAPQPHPGEISAEAREKIRQIIRNLPLDDATIDHWFARHTTDIRPGHTLPDPDEELTPAALHERVTAGETLWRSEYCRYAHYTDESGKIRLFVAGEEQPLAAGLEFAATLLAGQRTYSAVELVPLLGLPGFSELLCALHNEGCLYFPEDEDDEPA